MAGSKSTDLENRTLDGIYGGPQLDLPVTIRFRLYTVPPSDAGGGVEVDTGDWTNYAPADLTNNSTNFPASTGGMKANGVDISFGSPTLANPVTLYAWASFDEDTGDFLHWGEFNPPVPVVADSEVVFSAGDLIIIED